MKTKYILEFTHELVNKPITYQLIYDKENCVDCGSCTGVCHSEALFINKPDRIITYEPKKCTACGLCIKACPLQLFKLNFDFKNANQN